MPEAQEESEGREAVKISRELEQQILAVPGVVVRHAGQVEAAPVDPEPSKPKLIEAGVVVLHRTFQVVTKQASSPVQALVAHFPIETASEINGREWKSRSRRTGKAWRLVSQTLGPHLRFLATFAEAYHRGQALLVTFTRLGGRRLDAGNLPTATKATEDAVAFMLGANDGDPRWHPRWEQEPGGAVGVRDTCPSTAEAAALSQRFHLCPDLTP